MTSRTLLFAAAAATVALAAPAAAQYQQPYQYPQQYPQTYPQQYGQPYQGYGQTYGQDYAQNPVGAIIDQLLGNRYSVSDRQAVRQCATAAMAQANAQYGGYGSQYGGYGYRNQGYGSAFRVTSITDVQRRYNGLRVRGLMSTGYGSQNGYQNRGYGAQQISFRCDVDYRGAVTNIRIGSNRYRGY